MTQMRRVIRPPVLQLPYVYRVIVTYAEIPIE